MNYNRNRLQPLQNSFYKNDQPVTMYETGWWDTAKKYAGDFVSPFFNWASGFVTPAQPAVSSGTGAHTETGILNAAIAAGQRDENQLSNLLFYKRHPELNNQPLSSSQPNFSALSKEWLLIRDGMVRPALRAATSQPVNTAPANSGTDWSKVSESSRMLYVMEKLVQVYGLPVNGAAGIVGNLKAESGVIPNRIEGSKGSTPMTAKNFSGAMVTFSATEVMNRNSSTKYGPALAGAGLAQWTSSGRRKGLFAHNYNGQVPGASIMYNMDAQIDYLVYELKNSYRSVYTVVSRSSVTVNDAADEVVYNFERPGSMFEPGSNYTKLLPRTDSRVQQVFAVRRGYAQQALAAYKTKHP